MPKTRTTHEVIPSSPAENERVQQQLEMLVTREWDGAKGKSNMGARAPTKQQQIDSQKCGG